VRFTRLVVEAERTTVSLGLHPRLTVVAGVDERVRSGLVDELVGGLGGDRAGVHLELVDDHDRHLAVFRPTGGASSVIEVDDGLDVTEEFCDHEGRIDLFAHHGIDRRRARPSLHLDRARLAADNHRDEVVTRLAELDQGALWSAASRVLVTDEHLRDLGVEAEGADETELVEAVERRHQSVETAVEQQQHLRRSAMMVAAFCLAVAVPVALVAPDRAVPILALGAISVVLTLVYRARVEAAILRETAALAEAGADSYLSFVVQRVDGMLSGTEQRRRTIAVAEDHRAAAVHWTRLAGDVSVEWAMAHHEEIEATARLRRQLRSLGQVSSTAPDIDEEAADVAHALMSHLSRLRRLGTTGESFPLILDDPFDEVPASTRLSLLELLSRTAGSPQVILLTEREDVASWARLEALTGEVALVEPRAEPRDAAARGTRDLAV
jgi:hypothetical protein